MLMLRRLKNKLFHGTPIRTYKDVVECDYEIVAYPSRHEEDPNVVYINRISKNKNWTVAVNLDTTKVTIDDNDEMLISVDYTLVGHSLHSEELSNREFGELDAILQHFFFDSIMKYSPEEQGV